MDIVERLLAWDIGLHDEAANEIERLRNKVRWLEMCENTVVKQNAEIERLREALKDLLDATDQFVFQENYPLAVKKSKAALKEGE